MIVGTVGHIDHGKTALVRALTGIDADRLPEEKRRGITIELGYAFMPASGGERIGFIDMPGHEKLVRTMVAGASGIDYALLLIAADDGIMPQTVEHLTILSLMGLRHGAAVITKIDRVDDKVRHERESQVHQLLATFGLNDYPVFAVSALRGDGVGAVRDLLLHEAQHAAAAMPPGMGFRMSLDRAFTLEGIGTVVAGSVAAGTVRIADELCLAHAPDRHYRVRSLHVHDQAVTAAHAGQRCAVGLAGMERRMVERGQMLCDPAIAQVSSRLDICLQLASTEPRPLRSGTLVHLHAGTQECMATVAILGEAAIAPGKAALAQVVMQQPLGVWQMDRFILRDASAGRTVGGGTVLDTDAPARYRQTPQRLAALQTQRAPEPMVRLQGALAHAPFGINGLAWLRSAGFREWPFDPGALDDAVFDHAREWIISRKRLAESENVVVQSVRGFHARYPQDIGPDTQRARRLVAPRMPSTLWDRLMKHMVGAGSIAIRNGFLYLPEHGVQLHAAEKIVAERALPLLLDGGFDPPWVRDIAAATRLQEMQVRQVFARMAQAGELYQIVKDLYYHPKCVQELALLARDIAQREDGVTAATFRDATGLGRKRAIQILEFFDRIGFLRRVGDVHLVRERSRLC